MAAYIMASIHVTDSQQYAKYTAITPGIISQYGGRFIVRGGLVETLEGPAVTRRIVVIEFPTLEQAKAFYHSAEYARAKELRVGAAEASFFVVEGSG